ncbi:MAG: pilus assembly protein [Alphaproteobacteria bacterium]|nr:pilus assembly protein [Alphaproteobacteria bacterium]MBU1527040.1 pilus assembly protein [Alphaproteobacteria bacterium]MBU2116417.1 pilus assembly protein [Alphaproteobacteria bacterium]MBU2352393.1 pilus assembly protein [Alphaproteobacteria bacterium]MBU2382153.1 pilus assembly protein [Alphaproteobacteria bacterium]
MRRSLLNLRRRRRPREGAAAVEFGMIALPFLFMLFAIAEIAFVFVLDSVLENAVIETGRLIRTGQASAQGFTADNFKSRMCDRMTVFASGCLGKVHVDVRVVGSYTNPTLPDPMQGGAFSATGLTYQNGAPGNLILARAWYRHTLFTPFLAQGLARGGADSWLMASTAFQNEPWN